MKRKHLEVHRGCGGMVQLRHELWVCRTCGAGPIPVADTDTVSHVKAKP